MADQNESSSISETSECNKSIRHHLDSHEESSTIDENPASCSVEDENNAGMVCVDNKTDSNDDDDDDSSKITSQVAIISSAGSEVTMLQALHDKYGCDEPLSITICVSNYAPGISDSGQLIVPPVLGLAQNISSIGDIKEVGAICRNVVELDLCQNKLSNWEEVIILLKNLPKLDFLNIGDNPLFESPRLTKEHLSELPSTVPLTRLVLNATKLPWSDIWTLLGALKSVHELHFALNDLEKVDPPPNDVTFMTLKKLFLNKNRLRDAADLRRISCVFPHLCSLILLDNHIKESVNNA